jgi:hypothetical protein
MDPADARGTDRIMGLKEGSGARARFGAGLARLFGTAGGEGAVEEGTSF